MFGTQDIILIGIIVLVLFGGSKLPQIGNGVGQAIRNFKKGISEADAIDVTPKNKADATPKQDSSKKETTKRED
jgi:sec-independent protein translocase protein TatA